MKSNIIRRVDPYSLAAATAAEVRVLAVESRPGPWAVASCEDWTVLGKGNT